MKKRNLNLIVNKDGHGTINYKIALPKSWLNQMGLSETERNVIISFDDDKILIEKGVYNMFKVIEFFDVYRKDLLDKYGSKEYYYHEIVCNTTTEIILGNFKTEKESIKFAKEHFLKISSEKKLYDISGNNIYLKRIDVLNCEDEDSPENIKSFGLSLEDFEKIINS